MGPEVVVVDGARHLRRGLRCEIGVSSDTAAGWGRHFDHPSCVICVSVIFCVSVR